VQIFRLLLLGLTVHSEGPICDPVASNKRVSLDSAWCPHNFKEITGETHTDSVLSLCTVKY
jgi:hypothetical protein